MFCPNPVAFTVFGHDIYWYGILISLAVVIAVVMVYMQAKKKGIDPDSIENNPHMLTYFPDPEPDEQV